MVVPLF